MPTRNRSRSRITEALVITTSPISPLYPFIEGSVNQKMVEALAVGATAIDLQRVCIRKDGLPWKWRTIVTALYDEVNQKGYGIRTQVTGKQTMYFLVLPDGYKTFLPPRENKSERRRHIKKPPVQAPRAV